MTEKKERQQTPVGFLRKAQGKVSAAGFLAEQRAWLLSLDAAIAALPVDGEPLKTTSPILAKVDNGSLLPTPALAQIGKVVLDFHLATETAKAEAAQDKSAMPGAKPLVTTIYDADGVVLTKVTEKGEIKDLIEKFTSEADAQGWADRRLFEQSPGSYAVIRDGRMASWERMILRDASVSRIMKEKKKAVMTHGPAKEAPLTSRMRVAPTHFRTSGG